MNLISHGSYCRSGLEELCYVRLECSPFLARNHLLKSLKWRCKFLRYSFHHRFFHPSYTFHRTLILMGNCFLYRLLFHSSSEMQQFYDYCYHGLRSRVGELFGRTPWASNLNFNMVLPLARLIDSCFN